MVITWPGNHGVPTGEALLLTELDETDRDVLHVLQSGIPLNNRPYKEIGERAGLSESEVLERVQNMLDRGVLRKVGAILAPRKLGYVSTLAAVYVPKSDIDIAARLINSYESVTHNYLREGEPNIWFTMTEPDSITLDRNLADIEKAIGRPVIRMPVEKFYRIGVKFDI